MEKILYVEDDLSLIDGLKYALVKSGYLVDNARTVKEALAFYRKNKYDLLLLDITLLDGSGFDICKEIRNQSTIPIIFLTASDEEINVVRGLDMGGDDYVTKPFGMMELISRIKAVLRRSANGSISSEDTFEIGEIRLNPKKHEVTVHGEVVNLTLKEYELLKRLMKNSNIVLTRDQLLEDIWGYDFDGETRTVDVHVRTLRQKLGDAGEQIETVRGVGYRMSR